MVEVAVMSLVAGLILEGWVPRVLLAPLALGLYAVARFRFSPTVRTIKDVECNAGWKWLYVPIFAYNFIISMAICGVVGILLGGLWDAETEAPDARFFSGM